MTSQTIEQALKEASLKLQKTLASDVHESTLEAELLLLHALEQTDKTDNSQAQYNRTYLRTWSDKSLAQDTLNKFQHLLNQRLKGEPIAYILGEREFWSFSLKVNEHTLIPRSDTETLVEAALEKIPESEPWTVLDLGTGSGAIALAIAIERPKAQVFASDFSQSALQIAQDNAKNLNIKNLSFYRGDWMQGLKPKTKFNLIVSNPPYIKAGDPHLSQGDLCHEPVSALASGVDGLDDIHKILSQAKNHLVPGAYIMLEHGYDQEKEILALMEEQGYKKCQQVKDLAGIIRVSIGQID